MLNYLVLFYERIVNNMDKQKINCTVGSCKFNDGNSRECMLKQITVTPVMDVHTENPDESMCSSYENFEI